MTRPSKTHAWDHVWQDTQSAHWLSHQEPAPSDHHREVADALGQLSRRQDLTIEVIHLVGEAVHYAYEAGRFDALK